MTGISDVETTSRLRAGNSAEASDGRTADTREPQAMTLDMNFAREGGEGPTPYEVTAADGDSTPFTRHDSTEETWRIMAPLRDSPPPVHPYAAGSGGPTEADGPPTGAGRRHDPWLAS